MAIVRAIVDGERDPPSGSPARRAVQEVQPEFVEHLSGNWREEHLFNLESALTLRHETRDCGL